MPSCTPANLKTVKKLPRWLAISLKPFTRMLLMAVLKLPSLVAQVPPLAWPSAIEGYSTITDICPKVKLVAHMDISGDSIPVGQAAAENALTANPNIKVFIGQSTAHAQGIANAIKALPNVDVYEIRRLCWRYGSFHDPNCHQLRRIPIRVLSPSVELLLMWPPTNRSRRCYRVSNIQTSSMMLWNRSPAISAH